MKKHHISGIILFFFIIFLFSLGTAWAYPVSISQTTLISSVGEPAHTVSPKPMQNAVILQNTSTVTNNPQSYSASGTGYAQTSNADPGSFYVDTAISAGNGVNYSSVDGVSKWFVLNGGIPGSVVSLTTDITFQGQISATAITSTAAFTNYLGFLSSTASTQYEYLIVQNGVVNSLGSLSWSLTGTVSDFVEPNGTYEINEVIRSNVFNVTVGTPFRLALVLNTTVATNAVTGNTASIDFDPGFYTGYFSDGFAIYNNGNYIALNTMGYNISAAAVPEPSTMLLLAFGLMGLAGVRRKFYK